MKGENISGDTAEDLSFDSMFNGGILGALLGSNSKVDRVREDVFNTSTDEYTVDTVEGFDTSVWETGIQDVRYNYGSWIIVSQYPDREAAELGHAAWADEMENGPPSSLEDVFSGKTHVIDGNA